jgi:hypothetical protein
MKTPKDSSADRQLIEMVARGEVTPESDPQVFAEDLLIHSLLRLCQEDRAWLASIAQTAPPELQRQIRSMLETYEKVRKT